jgi:hypothetical protein
MGGWERIEERERGRRLAVCLSVHDLASCQGTADLSISEWDSSLTCNFKSDIRRGALHSVHCEAAGMCSSWSGRRS